MLSQNGQAGAEIEVTPAMVEAGVLMFCEYDPDGPSRTVRQVVQAIYLAMMAEKSGISPSRSLVSS